MVHVMQNILELHSDPGLAAVDANGWEDTSSPGALAGGCCFDFNQVSSPAACEAPCLPWILAWREDRSDQ